VQSCCRGTTAGENGAKNKSRSQLAIRLEWLCEHRARARAPIHNEESKSAGRPESTLVTYSGIPSANNVNAARSNCSLKFATSREEKEKRERVKSGEDQHRNDIAPGMAKRPGLLSVEKPPAAEPKRRRFM
jgi:hypothetical protein